MNSQDNLANVLTVQKDSDVVEGVPGVGLFTRQSSVVSACLS